MRPPVDEPARPGEVPPPYRHVEARAVLPPLFCLTIIVSSVVVYLLNAFTGVLDTVTSLPDGRPVVIGLFDLYGPAVAQGQWWRLLTAAVDHHAALHLVLNMSVVWTLGTGLEREMGTARFALVSLTTALGSSVLVLLLDFDQVTVGASGMIIGWAGVLLPIATREARRSLTVWLVQIAVISLLPFVSWSGHLGGFLAGLPAGFALRKGPHVFRWVAPLLVLAMALAVAAAAHLGGSR
jgi:rhomboid protease GluP